jgi:hypothetical protein
VPPKKTAISRANHLEGDSIYRPDKRNVKRRDIPLSANVEDNAVFYLASDIVKGENIFGHPILKNVKNYHVKCPYCEEKAITIKWTCKSVCRLFVVLHFKLFISINAH